MSLVPQDINIDPNSNGLPAISRLQAIIGATLTVGMILACIASAIVWALGANSPNSHLARCGKFGVLVGLGATVIAGALVNLFWNVGQSV